MCKNPVSESVTGQEMRLPWTHRLDVTGGSTDKWGVGWGKKNDTLEARPSELDVWLCGSCAVCRRVRVCPFPWASVFPNCQVR